MFSYVFHTFSIFLTHFFPGKSPGSLQTRLPQSIQALLGPRPRGAVTHNSGRGRKSGDLGTEDVSGRPECYWKWPIEIVDLPNLKMVMFHSYVSLPEGIYTVCFSSWHSETSSREVRLEVFQASWTPRTQRVHLTKRHGSDTRICGCW